MSFIFTTANHTLSSQRKMEIKEDLELNFESACTSPYVSAPSSPKKLNSYFSAPTSPNPNNIINEYEDFAFDFSGHLERPFLSAEELFDGGKIKALNPFPVRGMHGRERTQYSRNSSRRDKGTRSLSPLRVSDMLFQPEENEETSTSSRWNTKWKVMKNLLLFKSASEGRKTNKETLKNFVLLKKIHSEDLNSPSLVGKKETVSAHELHYKVNRVASGEMKRKTYLPYKRGLLGCLGFNQGLHFLSPRVAS